MAGRAEPMTPAERTKRKARKTKVRSTLLDFSEHTTSHGIYWIGATGLKNPKRCMFWSVAFILCLFLFLYQASVMISRYLRYDTIVNIELDSYRNAMTKAVPGDNGDISKNNNVNINGDNLSASKRTKRSAATTHHSSPSPSKSTTTTPPSSTSTTKTTAEKHLRKKRQIDPYRTTKTSSSDETKANDPDPDEDLVEIFRFKAVNIDCQCPTNINGECIPIIPQQDPDNDEDGTTTSTGPPATGSNSNLPRPPAAGDYPTTPIPQQQPSIFYNNRQHHRTRRHHQQNQDHQQSAATGGGIYRHYQRRHHHNRFRDNNNYRQQQRNRRQALIPTTCNCFYDVEGDTVWPCYRASAWGKTTCTFCSYGGTCVSPHKTDAETEANSKHSVLINHMAAYTTTTGSGTACYCQNVSQFCVAHPQYRPAYKLWEVKRTTTTPGPTTTTESTEAINFEKAQGFGNMTDEVAITTKAKENLVYTVASLQVEKRMEISYKKRDLLRKCSFNGKECDFDEDFGNHLDPVYGNCYTFNYKRDTDLRSTRAGPFFG